VSIKEPSGFCACVLYLPKKERKREREREREREKGREKNGWNFRSVGVDPLFLLFFFYVMGEVQCKTASEAQRDGGRRTNHKRFVCDFFNEALFLSLLNVKVEGRGGLRRKQDGTCGHEKSSHCVMYEENREGGGGEGKETQGN
jgi:hypothetical protein